MINMRHLALIVAPAAALACGSGPPAKTVLLTGGLTTETSYVPDPSGSMGDSVPAQFIYAPKLSRCEIQFRTVVGRWAGRHDLTPSQSSPEPDSRALETYWLSTRPAGVFVASYEAHVEQGVVKRVTYKVVFFDSRSEEQTLAVKKRFHLKELAMEIVEALKCPVDSPP